LHTPYIPPSRYWRVAGLITAFVVWSSLQVWAAATVSTQTFGRYEIVLQEGIPVALGEILGTVRRQTGLPEYPLILAAQRGVLELSIVGPGNRPIRLTSTPFRGSAGAGAATARFIVERSLRRDETLTLQMRPASSSGQYRLTVDLQSLERMLEGEQ
jgi:hypothetical protein